jgi:hypothetical protein
MERRMPIIGLHMAMVTAVNMKQTIYRTMRVWASVKFFRNPDFEESQYKPNNPLMISLPDCAKYLTSSLSSHHIAFTYSDLAFPV